MPTPLPDRTAPHPDHRAHYGLDIETDTAVDGLDPACSAVVAVALATPQGDEVLLGEESSILRRLDARLAALAPGVIVTWNGSSFDLPFLAVRAAHHGVALGLELARRPGRPAPRPGSEHAVSPSFAARWGPHAHLDGYRLYRADVGRRLGLSCALKAVARLAGISPVEVDRSRIHTLDDRELGDYVASDARLARELVSRRLPAASSFVDRPPPGGWSPVRPAPDELIA